MSVEQPVKTLKKMLLRPESVAEVLDISERTFREWVSKEEFPPPDFTKGGKFKFWKMETVENWIEGNCR